MLPFIKGIKKATGLATPLLAFASMSWLLSSNDRQSVLVGWLLAAALAVLLAVMGIALRQVISNPKFPFRMSEPDIRIQVRPLFEQWQPVADVSDFGVLIAGLYMIWHGGGAWLLGVLMTASLVVSHVAVWTLVAMGVPRFDHQ